MPQKLPFKNLFLLHLLRSGLRLAGGYKKVAETTNGMATPLPFSKSNAQESLDTSLRELGSDYVDFLLLHEYDTDAANKAEVVGFLQEQVKLGKIRAFGIGSSFKKLPKNLDDIDKTYKMIQLESSFSAPNLLQFQGHSNRLISTHSIFRDFEKVKASLSKYSPKELGVSMNTDTDLINVFLSFSKLHNPSGITIFTSSNNQRIKQNADLWQSNDYSLHQLEELQKKISGVLVD
jgi:diketogulonate reductase-like aldo/keto reductase